MGVYLHEPNANRQPDGGSTGRQAEQTLDAWLIRWRTGMQEVKVGLKHDSEEPGVADTVDSTGCVIIWHGHSLSAPL